MFLFFGFWTNQTMLKLTYCNLHHHLILTLIGNMMINQAETDFSPLQVSDLPQKYQVDQAEQLLQWLGNLADPAEPVRSVSWFQIYALYGYQTGCKGVRHQTKKKKWIDGKNDVKYVDFVRRANYLSDWIQGVWKSNSRPCTLLHLRPESNCIQFWTQCVSLRIRFGALQLADDILLDSQKKINSVRALRNF